MREARNERTMQSQVHRNAPTLTVIGGPLSGTLYTLDRELTIIGRDPDCDMVLQPMSVSRHHAAIRHYAAITQHTGYFMLEDMGSTRGTSLNGRRLTEPSLLRSGDMIELGESRLIFDSDVVFIVNEDLPGTVVADLTEGEQAEEDQTESVLTAVLVDHRSGEKVDSDQHSPGSESATSTDQELGKFASSFYEATSPTDSIREECARIRDLLESNHVKWDNADHRGLIDEILKPDTDLRGVLGTGFYRLVVLDAAHGLGPAGLFDEHQFLEAVRAELVHAFGLRLDGTAFHIEDIFQMLKDEQRSLFCFVNFQLIPVVHFRTVRGFTQGLHRVLLLTRGRRDIAHEEGLWGH